jgi:HEAT repeat protein
MFPVPALQVAEAALTHPDSDSRWQVAVLLGRIGTPSAVALLGRFLADDEEYVRRRAGFALRQANAEPGAPPNGGPATPLGNSGVAVGPPPVS